jgi:hypothetical protein
MDTFVKSNFLLPYPKGHTLQGTSKGRARVGMGKNSCNDYINHTPYPKGHETLTLPPEGEGDLRLFTKSSQRKDVNTH